MTIAEVLSLPSELIAETKNDGISITNRYVRVYVYLCGLSSSTIYAHTNTHTPYPSPSTSTNTPFFLSILDNINQLGENYPLSETDEVQITTDTVTIIIKQMLVSDFNGDRFEDGMASISLPASLLDGISTDSVRITFSSFSDDSLFVSRSPSSDSEGQLVVGSMILSLDVVGQTVDNLGEPVVLEFLLNVSK